MNSIPELLDSLFPGDRKLGMPRFSEISETITQRFYQEASPYIVELEKAFSKETRGNDFLNEVDFLRKCSPVTTRAFTRLALQTYFAEPKVIKLLQNGEAVLFPHSRALPDIDYDLLQPVIDLYEKDWNNDFR